MQNNENHTIQKPNYTERKTYSENIILFKPEIKHKKVYIQENFSKLHFWPLTWG